MDTKVLVSHLENLGFKLNKMKSCFVPIQEIIYLGLYRRSASGQFTAVYPFFRREKGPTQTIFTSSETDGLSCLKYSTGTVGTERVSVLNGGAGLSTLR